jgi:hypothetical protein
VTELTFTTTTLVGALVVFLVLQAWFAIYRAWTGGTNRVNYFLYWVLGSIVGGLGFWVALIVLPQLGVV